MERGGETSTSSARSWSGTGARGQWEEGTLHAADPGCCTTPHTVPGALLPCLSSLGLELARVPCGESRRVEEERNLGHRSPESSPVLPFPYFFPGGSPLSWPPAAFQTCFSPSPTRRSLALRPFSSPLLLLHVFETPESRPGASGKCHPFRAPTSWSRAQPRACRRELGVLCSGQPQNGRPGGGSQNFPTHFRCRGFTQAPIWGRP